MANHPGSIAKRGPSYRVRLTVEGERHYYTLKSASREEAEEFAKTKDVELRKRARAGLPGRVTFSQLLDQYEEDYLPTKAPETRRGYRITLDALRSYFVDELDNPLATEVRKGHVKRFLTWRRHHQPDGSKRKKALTARTLAKERATLSGIFSFAEEHELVEANPVRGVKPPKGDTRQPIILDADQYERLIQKAAEDPMLLTYVLVLGEAGLRSGSEALWLRWQDVDLEDGFLTVESVRKGRRTKSGKIRSVPMTPRLRKAMREHFARFRFAVYGSEGKRTPWLFHHRIRNRTAKAGDRLGCLRGSFYAAAERAGLQEELNQHDLRHRRATTWLQQGKPMHLVQKALGHSSITVTERYTHLVTTDLRALVETPSVPISVPIAAEGDVENLQEAQ